MDRITFGRGSNSRGVLVATLTLIAIVAATLFTSTAAHAANQRPVPKVVEQWAAAWNTGSPEQMAGLFTEDGVYEDHAFQVAFQGKDGIAQWVSITNSSLNDTHVEVNGAFRCGKRIAVQWTFSGTDSAGGLAGQPPTGKSFSVPAVSIFEMKGNKIRRVDDYYNLADLLRQLGQPSDAAEPGKGSEK